MSFGFWLYFLAIVVLVGTITFLHISYVCSTVFIFFVLFVSIRLWDIGQAYTYRKKELLEREGVRESTSENTKQGIIGWKERLNMPWTQGIWYRRTIDCTELFEKVHDPAPLRRRLAVHCVTYALGVALVLFFAYLLDYNYFYILFFSPWLVFLLVYIWDLWDSYTRRKRELAEGEGSGNHAMD